MTKEEFYNYVKELGINLSDDQVNKLELFADLLLKYNETTNITAIRDREGVYLKHFYDSLTLSSAIKLENQSVLDVGSGGGFPGIVIAICYPTLDVTLLDSNNKKSTFQQYIVDNLKLDNVKVVNSRAEDYFKLGNKYDLVCARAVANMSVLSELCLPFVKVNGNFIAMKAEYGEEVNSAKGAISILGGKINNVLEINLPICGDSRALIDVLKVKETPNMYPRAYDKIIKKPLK